MFNAVLLSLLLLLLLLLCICKRRRWVERIFSPICCALIISRSQPRTRSARDWSSSVEMANDYGCYMAVSRANRISCTASWQPEIDSSNSFSEITVGLTIYRNRSRCSERSLSMTDTCLYICGQGSSRFMLLVALLIMLVNIVLLLTVALLLDFDDKRLLATVGGTVLFYISN